MTHNEFVEAVRAYGSAYAGITRYHDSNDGCAAAEDWERYTRGVLTAEFDALTSDVARLTAEIERMRPVNEAAMVYVRHVRCRDGSGSGGLITKHHALLEAGCKAMEETAS